MVVVSEDHDTGDEAWLGACVVSDDVESVNAGLIRQHFGRVAGSGDVLHRIARGTHRRVGKAFGCTHRPLPDSGGRRSAGVGPRSDVRGAGGSRHPSRVTPLDLSRWMPSDTCRRCRAGDPRRAGRIMTGDRLASAVAATAYQRAWFQQVRRDAASGQPIAFVNADAPHEIFRALGIPYVVNQWWASVIAAKGAGPASLARLGGARTSRRQSPVRRACAGRAGSAMRTTAPWGGLPTPAFAVVGAQRRHEPQDLRTVGSTGRD